MTVTMASALPYGRKQSVQCTYAESTRLDHEVVQAELVLGQSALFVLGSLLVELQNHVSVFSLVPIQLS